MKTGIYIAALFFISLTAVKAQKPIVITDESVKFGNTLCPGIWVDIPEVNPESVRKSWIKAIEKGTKSNTLTTGNEMTIFGANIKEIYEGPVNLYSMITYKDSLVKLFVSAELKRDEFAIAGSKERVQLIAWVKQFAKDQYVKVAMDQLSDQESALKDLEKDMASLKKAKENHEKDIQSSNNTISEENYKIVNYNKEIPIVDASLDASGTALNSLSDGDAKKAKQKEIKELEKKKRNLLDNIKKSENKISRSNQTILDCNNAIPINISKQEALSTRINAQKLVVGRYIDKLKTIESY